MEREAWQQVDRLYHAALEQPAAERSAFLNDACTDPDLRREVESLLSFEPSGRSLFDCPAWEKRLAPGERLGPYEIVGRAGAGGMGEVWKARDTRLGRDVAIKVCAERFSDRFRREARAIAALNHPHICTLYDVGADCLVMEYIEGAPIQGPMPAERALKFGAQIADALDAAHRKGIVHRDLKPANILVTKSGVKVLDFGLAKMQTAVAGCPLGPAETKTATERGAIVGTLHYMSPEQVQGKETDARSDIFSFGVVLYEMLTGRRAFEAENSASVIAAILEREPPNLEEIGPAGLQRVLRRCLAKDPAERWQSAADLKAALEWTAEVVPQTAGSRRRVGVGWLAAGLLAAGLAVTLVVHLREKPPEQRVVRLEIPPPGNSRFTEYDTPVLSPDGTRIAFSAGGKLFVRSLDSLATQELPGTEGGQLPFWSPDGRSLAFFAGGKLKKASLVGGPTVVLCDTSGSPLGGAWNRDGVIIFALSPWSSLMRIGAGGGTPVPVTRREKGQYHHAQPSFLPDGKHFLFTVYAASNGGVFIGSLDSPQVTRLLPEEINAQYTEPGYVLFGRGGILMAQPFDAGRLRFTGDPFPLAQEVSAVRYGGYGSLSAAAFSASAGVLAYRSGGLEGPQRLRWFDRKGNRLGDVGPVGEYWDPALSPDGHAVAVSMRTASTWDIWVFDLVRGTNSRLTFGGGNHYNPNWSPDGRQIAFRFVDGPRWVVHRVLANSNGKEEPSVQLDRNAIPSQWTGDGRYLILMVGGAPGKWEIWAAPLAAGGKPFPVITGPFGNGVGRVSPDGKWIAYTGDETGRYEVYVQDFPPKGGKWQISTAGGFLSAWRADGRELFYWEGSKMMCVGVKTNAGRLEAGIPKFLFDAPRSHSDLIFDVSADGQKFLLVVPDEETGSPPITVVLNWQAGIKR
jgi:Tol biopolymer transport system component